MTVIVHVVVRLILLCAPILVLGCDQAVLTRDSIGVWEVEDTLVDFYIVVQPSEYIEHTIDAECVRTVAYSIVEKTDSTISVSTTRVIHLPDHTSETILVEFDIDLTFLPDEALVFEYSSGQVWRARSSERQSDTFVPPCEPGG